MALPSFLNTTATTKTPFCLLFLPPPPSFLCIRTASKSWSSSRGLFSPPSSNFVSGIATSSLAASAADIDWGFVVARDSSKDEDEKVVPTTKNQCLFRRKKHLVCSPRQKTKVLWQTTDDQSKTQFSLFLKASRQTLASHSKRSFEIVIGIFLCYYDFVSWLPNRAI